MSSLLQQIINGIVFGSLLALIALGYTMVYGIIQLINFAHGEVFMVGAFGALYVYRWFLPAAITDHWYFLLPVLLVVASLVSAGVALLMERFAYRPLRNAPKLAPLITALGVSVFLQEFVRNFYRGPGGEKATGPVPFPHAFVDGRVSVGLPGWLGGGSIGVPATGLLLVAVSAVLATALQIYVNQSRMGRAMRATAQDPDTARLMGINPDRTIVLTFVLGAVLAGVAGVLSGVHLPPINTDMGFQNGIFAFTAAVLGGIGSLRGAVFGALIIGLVKTLADSIGFIGGSKYDYVWIFVVLIGVLVFRPQGLFGEAERVRA